MSREKQWRISGAMIVFGAVGMSTLAAGTPLAAMVAALVSGILFYALSTEDPTP